MPRPIAIKISLSKLKKEWFFAGKNGKLCDLVLYPNDEPDQYGNQWAIKQNPPKEQKEAGEKGHYVGNGKEFGNSTEQRQAPPQRKQQPQTLPPEPDDDSGIPF